MASSAFLPYGRQSIDGQDVASVERALRAELLTTGPTVEEYEEELCRKLQVKNVVACSSGTAALHLSAMALKLGPGDSVVVPTLTFLATANAVRYMGAEVIFADVDAQTGLLGPQQFEDALKRARAGNVAAVFPVHLNGQPVDMVEIRAIADKCEIRVVEDACHALGGLHQGMPIGNCANSVMACFSTHPVKAIATGEGGFVTANDPNLANAMRRYRSHGVVRNQNEMKNPEMAFSPEGDLNPWYYEMHELGWNYRLSDINCALGLSQLSKLSQFIERRRELARLYDELLQPLNALVRPLVGVPWGESARHLYVIHIDFAEAGIGRAKLVKALRDKGIGVQVHYLPVHLQPYYRDRYGSITLPGADSYYRNVLSLPLYAAMTNADVIYVIDMLEKSIRR